LIAAFVCVAAGIGLTVAWLLAVEMSGLLTHMLPVAACRSVEMPKIAHGYVVET
jgi:hypothetical protein